MYFPLGQVGAGLENAQGGVPAAILSLLWGTELVTISAIKDTTH